MAQVMCFLQENGIDSFEELTARAEEAVAWFNSLGDSIKAAVLLEKETEQAAAEEQRGQEQHIDPNR